MSALLGVAAVAGSGCSVSKGGLVLRGDAGEEETDDASVSPTDGPRPQDTRQSALDGPVLDTAGTGFDRPIPDTAGPGIDVAPPTVDMRPPFLDGPVLLDRPPMPIDMPPPPVDMRPPTPDLPLPVDMGLPLTAGLVGHWRMDEAAGSAVVPDSTSNANDGLLFMLDADLVWVPGKVANAIDIKGNSGGVIVKASPSIDAIGTTFAITAWVKLTNNRPNLHPLISRQSTSVARDDMFFFGISDLRPYFHGERLGSYPALSPLALDQWIHLAVTYDGTTIRLYVNGGEVLAVARSGSVAGINSSVVIGGNQNDSQGNITEQWPGLIDELRLYSRWLSPAEVFTLSR